MRITSAKDMRMKSAHAPSTKRPVNLTLDRDLVARARTEGLNLSAIAEHAVAAALAQQARARWDAEIALACEEHAQYLAEYGSVGDHVRAQLDEEE